MNPSISSALLPVRTTPKVRSPALIQGVYWVLSGVWPLIHRTSFEWVTGPKVDFWLVELVGLLLALMGSVMILAYLGDRVTPEIALLSAGGAALVSIVSIVYVARERIPPTYLIDVVLELILIAAWVRWFAARPRRHPIVIPPDVLSAAAAASAARRASRV